MANHTWGRCYSNTANKKPKPNGDKAKKRPEKSKKDKNDEMSIELSTTAHGTQDSLSTASELHRQQAVNDNLMVSTINNGMFAQLCIDLNEQVYDPNALVVKFKAACAATATSAEVNNGTYTYDAFTSTITHHLHDLSFHAMQEINTTVYDEIVGLNIVMKFTLMESQILSIYCLLTKHYDYMLLVMELFIQCKTLV
jgi:hypothetical protein